MRAMNLGRLALLSLALSGCAAHQLRFQPWAGIPAEEAAELKRGEFRAPKDALFDAAAGTLEHEPYLHWSVETLDKANGFIKADAGLLRELQLRVSNGDGGRSRLEVSIPRRPLTTQAKIYTPRGSGKATAYEPAEAELGRYRVQNADAELDADYLRSFTWHVLHDRVQVPFSVSLKDTEADDDDDDDDADEPVAIDQAPAAAAGASATAKSLPAGLPVRDAAGAPASVSPSPAP